MDLRRTLGRLRGTDGWSVPSTELRVTTEDGVDLAVSRLGGRRDRAVVLAHGLLGYRTKPAWRRLSEGLSRSFSVYAMDLRGHGDSAGACSGGPLEALDVRAGIEAARRDGARWVATVGGSLGGAAALFEAASTAYSDLVVAISPPSRWVRDLLHEPTEDDGTLRHRILWVFGSEPARVGARALLGTHIARGWAGVEPPIDAVDRCKRPLLIIHGDDDHLFPISTIEEMYRRAPEPKELEVRPGFGHCEDGFTDSFIEELREKLSVAAEGVFGDRSLLTTQHGGTVHSSARAIDVTEDPSEAVR